MRFRKKQERASGNSSANGAKANIMSLVRMFDPVPRTKKKSQLVACAGWKIRRHYEDHFVVATGDLVAVRAQHVGRGGVGRETAALERAAALDCLSSDASRVTECRAR